MYNAKEGKITQRRAELFSLCSMLALTALLGLFMWLTIDRYGIKTAYVVIYLLWLAVSAKLTRFYLFLTPRYRYGTVTDIKVSRGMNVPKVSGTGGFHGSGVTYVIDCTVTILFDNGKERDYDFVYDGAIKKLEKGDRVGIFRFLKMPVTEE